MSSSTQLPPGELQYAIGFGPDVNCTLALCPLEMSVTGYLPSLPVNIIFIFMYAAAGIIHLLLGIRWKSWWYMSMCVTSSISAIAGYIGRLILHEDPFGFWAFLIQGVFLTIVPVFYCAGIYVTLGVAISSLAPHLARFNPRLLPWIFLPCDLIALCAQSAGAVISASAGPENDKMVHQGEAISVIGLALQVITIAIFSILFVDFGVRYFKTPKGAAESTFYDTRIRFFFGFILVILCMTTARSAYRVAELNQGYAGELVREEALFIMMEGFAIVVSVFMLTIGHPGFVFGPHHTQSFEQIGDGNEIALRSTKSGEFNRNNIELTNRVDDMEMRLLKIENRQLSTRHVQVYQPPPGRF